ncbi:MAG TPA: zinc-ribbon domain-containing protein [Thermoplasmata archaeon]|nr:zinc-ribbon domain-containing protein [Thermoplasmata archaeon]
MVSRFCTRCGQPIPAGATTCPRCNAPVGAPAGSAAAGGATGSAEATASARRSCANCRAQMRWIGHYSLRASGPPSPAGGAGAPGEAAETLLPFSLYYCQSCGKFDFYYPGT